MGVITEIVELQTVDGISDEQFIEIVDELERGFHCKQKGFIDTELLRAEQSNRWIMIQHWQTMDNVKSASKKMFEESITENFRNAIDPRQVKMILLPQVKTWS